MTEDLRSRRTKKHLMEAFDDAVRQKPIGKITVKSLAETAEVSKQTFYLHYRDIYDIAEKWMRATVEEMVAGMDFVETFPYDPHAFVDGLFLTLRENREQAVVLCRSDLRQLFLPCFLESLEARVAEMRPSGENELEASVATTMVLSGLLALLPRYGDDSDVAKAAGDVLAHIAASMRGREVQ